MTHLFHEVDDVSRMNHNGENHPIIGCYRCYRSVRLIEIPIYNSKLIFYKKQTYFIENTILYIYSISIISSIVYVFQIQRCRKNIQKY